MLSRGIGFGWLRRNILPAIILGVALTVSSWVVEQPPYCPSVTPIWNRDPCLVMLRDRGFPLTWIVESGPWPPSPTWSLAQISSSVDFAGLGSDLALWTWLWFVGILAMKSKQRNFEPFKLRSLQSVCLFLGIASFAVGLLVAQFVAGAIPFTGLRGLLQADYESQFSASLLGYSFAVLGVGIAFAGYQRSRVAVWLSYLAAGFLATLATMVIPSLFQIASLGPNEYATYGFPLGWLLLVVSSGFTTLRSWAFQFDVMFWSLMFAALAAFVYNLRNLRTVRKISISNSIFWLGSSVLIGGLITLASFFVWRGIECNDTPSCAFPTLGRGFPVAWTRTFNIPPQLGSYFAGGTEILYPALVFDFVAWSWLIAVISLISRQETSRRNRFQPLGSTMAPGLATMIVGFLLALAYAQPKADYFLPFESSLPTLGFSVMTFGIAALIVTYERSKCGNWITYACAGVLITLATLTIQRSIPNGFRGWTEYGFPFSWLTTIRPTGPGGLDFLALSTVIKWAFIVDAVFWSSICFVALALLLAARSNRCITHVLPSRLKRSA